MASSVKSLAERVNICMRWATLSTIVYLTTGASTLPHLKQRCLEGPHAIDTLRWLMSVRFVEAQAYHATQQSRWSTTHTTVALFKANTGAVAKVTVSYGMVRPYCLYYSVYGAQGTFERSRPRAFHR